MTALRGESGGVAMFWSTTWDTTAAAERFAAVVDETRTCWCKMGRVPGPAPAVRRQGQHVALACGLPEAQLGPAVAMLLVTPGGAGAAQSDAAVPVGLSRETIVSVVGEHHGEVLGCYNRELVTQPALAGRLTVEMSIGASGQVLTAKKQSSTLSNVAVEQCLLEAVRGWKFPSPGERGVVVRYPFVFEPATGPAR